MKKKPPLISIIIPTYNSYKFLIQSIESVINQTYREWELIIIDDNSIDGTFKILDYYKKNKKIKCIKLLKNRGPAYCRNLGVKISKGKYISFLDSDDVWLKNKLKIQVKFMEKNKCSFTATNYSPFNEKKIIKEKKTKKKIIYKDFLGNTSIATSSLMVRRDILQNIRFLNNLIFDDMYFKGQLLKKVPCFMINKRLLYYRMRNHSISSNKIKNVKNTLKILIDKFKINYLSAFFYIFSISMNSIKKYNFYYNFNENCNISNHNKKIFFNKKKYNLIFGQY